MSVVRPTGVSLLYFLCSGIQLGVQLSSSPFYNLDLYVHGLEDDASITKGYFTRTKMLCLLTYFRIKG